MNIMKFLLVVLVAVAAASWAVVTPTSAHSVAVQNQGSTALERGYRTGYSDGYQAGFSDQSSRSARDYASKEDYKRADRAYVDAWGPIEDYRDGYQQGFEVGYGSGFEQKAFNSSLPSGFKRRGSANSASDANSSSDGNTPVDSTTTTPTSNTGVADNTTVASTGNLSIPRDTTFLVELDSSLSTDVSQRGDRFQARVIEPREYAGAVIDGRVTNVQRAGKLKGTAQLQLSFEQLRMPDNRTTNLHAEVIEVLQDAGSSGVGEVDREGGVKGTDSTKDDISKVGAATGIGAIIGAIAGGGKGAAIGAAIGGSVGTAGVLSSRGKDVRLARGQKMRIRTTTDTSMP
ncbi:MAG TPA: hypothetical protein VN643_12445 [Pyrinomonadaceae bacterium]|nr:hypothetical protein [Pyrinomonadaceae bacterium]